MPLKTVYYITVKRLQIVTRRTNNERRKHNRSKPAGWWMNEEIFDLAVEGKDEYCYQEIFDDYRSLFIAECNENGLDGEERFEEWLNVFEPEQISVFEHVTVEHKGEI